MNFLRSKWEFLFSIAAGGLSLATFPPDVFATSVSEIVTLLGFIIAAVVPAMTLSATSLRAGRLSPSHLDRLGLAIQRQINIFGGLLVFAFIASIGLILGKISDWKILQSISALLPFYPNIVSRLYVSALAFFLILAASRVFTVVHGIASVARLNTEIALSEARQTLSDELEKRQKDLTSYTLPVGYGSDLNPTVSID